MVPGWAELWGAWVRICIFFIFKFFLITGPTRESSGSAVKKLPDDAGVQETQVQSLGREDPLEEEMQPTPVFLSGESHGQRSLVGYSPWGPKELDTAERLSMHACIGPYAPALTSFRLQHPRPRGPVISNYTRRALHLSHLFKPLTLHGDWWCWWWSWWRWQQLDFLQHLQCARDFGTNTSLMCLNSLIPHSDPWGRYY